MRSFLEIDVKSIKNLENLILGIVLGAIEGVGVWCCWSFGDVAAWATEEIETPSVIPFSPSSALHQSSRLFLPIPEGKETIALPHHSSVNGRNVKPSPHPTHPLKFSLKGGTLEVSPGRRDLERWRDLERFPSPRQLQFEEELYFRRAALDIPQQFPTPTEHLPHFEAEFILPKEDSDFKESETAIDPELGILRLEEVTKPSPPTQPTIYLLGWVGYFRSNNIFSGIDPVDDGLFRGGLTFLTTHSLNSQTSLFAAVGGTIIRYETQSQFDYNQLNFNAGLYHQLLERTYLEVGGNNQQLFNNDRGDRFLNDSAIYLQLNRRDFLAERFAFDTRYQLRLSFADPENRSQVINALGTSFNYFPYDSMQVALDYQLALSHFTRQEREDLYNQLLIRLVYTLSPHSRIEIFGGRSFGGSSNSNIDFDGFVFGVGVGLTLF